MPMGDGVAQALKGRPFEIGKILELYGGCSQEIAPIVGDCAFCLARVPLRDNSCDNHRSWLRPTQSSIPRKARLRGKGQFTNLFASSSQILSLDATLFHRTHTPVQWAKSAASATNSKQRPNTLPFSCTLF